MTPGTQWYSTVLDGTRWYSTGTRRYSTVLDGTRSTVLDGTRRYSTVPEMVLDGTRLYSMWKLVETPHRQFPKSCFLPRRSGDPAGMSVLAAAGGESASISSMLRLQKTSTRGCSVDTNARRSSLRKEFQTSDDDRFAKVVVIGPEGETDTQLFERIFIASENGTKILQPEKRNQEDIEASIMMYHVTVRAYRKQLHAMQHMTLNPQGKLIARWDVLISIALMFTAIYLPYEIGFLPTTFRADTFTINR
eukprot:2180738-Prymnesium_polylepis.1